jgi:hypothetical protein
MKNMFNKASIISLLFLLMIFSPKFIQPRDQNIQQKSQSLLKKGMITHVDEEGGKIKLEDLESFVINDSTLDVIYWRRSRGNIKRLSPGQYLFIRYNKINNENVVEEYWVIKNIHEPLDIANYVYIQEKDLGKVLQGYHLGDFDIINARVRNQIHLKIYTQYLDFISENDQNYFDNKKLEINVVSQWLGEKHKVWNQEPVYLNKGEIKRSSPIIYDMEDLKLDEEDRIKVIVSLQKKENQGGNEEWRTISTREMRLHMKRSGLRSYSRETIAFVRDSFGKNWKPQPGASSTIGLTFFISQQTRGFKKVLYSSWNMIDPSIGLNLTLLDFDQDRSMEYGLGPVFSILGGAIYFGVGWNLTTHRSKNRYTFFGVSLTGIAEKIEGEFNKK